MKKLIYKIRDVVLSFFNKPTKSYHGVCVVVNGIDYKISRDYMIRLTCSKTGGWQLFNIWGESIHNPSLIGGEFDSLNQSPV